MSRTLVEIVDLNNPTSNRIPASLSTCLVITKDMFKTILLVRQFTVPVMIKNC